MPTPVEVGIDMDTAGNAANALGSREECMSIAAIGDTLDIDVVVKGVPPVDSGSGAGGLAGFQFNLMYDPTVVNVVAANADMMLTAGGGSIPFSLGDIVPDADGDFLTAEVDLGATLESGDGVLIRVTLRAVGQGRSPLALDETGSGDGVPLIVDGSGVAYPVSSVFDGEVVVGGTCIVDLDGDGVVNSLDPDDDGDRFDDVAELSMTTDERGACPTSASHDAWGPDRDQDRDADIGDVIANFNGKMFNPAGYDARSDPNVDGDNDIGDVIGLYGGGNILTKCVDFTFMNSSGGPADGIHIELSTPISGVFSALDSDLAGWSNWTIGGDGLTLDMDRPDGGGDLANGGQLTIVVQTASLMSPAVSPCQWMLDGADKGAC